MQKGRSMLGGFFSPLEQQPAVSKTEHLHMQCISFKTITVRQEGPPSEVAIPHRTLKMKMHEWNASCGGNIHHMHNQEHENTHTHTHTHCRVHKQLVSGCFYGKDNVQNMQTSHISPAPPPPSSTHPHPKINIFNLCLDPRNRLCPPAEVDLVQLQFLSAQYAHPGFYPLFFSSASIQQAFRGPSSAAAFRQKEEIKVKIK